MAKNIVIYNGNTLIDLTPTTATEDSVAKGKAFFKADGTQAIGTLTVPLTPVAYDYDIGYVDNGVWKWQYPTNTHTDIYEVEAGHSYIVGVGGTVGTRFRAMYTTVDVREVTSGNITGTTIINKNNPAKYDNATIKSVANDGYIIIGKDNNYVTGINTYVYDMTEGWL